MNANASRRDFLKRSGLLIAGTAALGAVPVRGLHAAGNDKTYKIGLVGCGGRGSGALLQALATEGPTKVVALADVFDEKIKFALRGATEHFPDDVDVPQERQFTELDGYKHVVDAVGPGGVVLFATAPAFRPMHVEYAVQKGVHVFMEKSFGVDAPGVQRLLKAGELASEKNLKIVGGLMSRHNEPLRLAIEQIHGGAIGECVTCWAYREHGPVGFTPKRNDESILAHQIRNYSCFTWLNGSFLLDWLIHNLDVCCWTKGMWPVSAQGQGGRQTRTEPDQLFDHYAVEYTFPDGTRLFAQGRHQRNTWDCFQSTIHGTKGCAVIGEGVTIPRIYKGYNPVSENMIWEHKEHRKDQYQIEHDVLFDCIRKDKPINETQRCCNVTMVGILGRLAAETGKRITWDEAMNSAALVPDLDNLKMNDPAPVMPDPNGNYPIAMPGS